MIKRNFASTLPTLGDIYDMDIKVEWCLHKLIPKQAITVLHGRAGSFKTWIMISISSCISEGKIFAGLQTLQMPCYYVDFENSLATLHHRATVLGRSSLRVWHCSNPKPPPRLDTKEWELYKRLEPPGLLIFDTLRSCQLQDENSSRAMAFIMTRLKELRDMGFTIVLIHHSPKGNDQTYKGSTAIVDLSDHVLSFERINNGGNGQEMDGEDVPLQLSVKKTRFEPPFSITLQFDPSIGFNRVPDLPDHDDESLKTLFDLLVKLKKVRKNPNQSQLAEMVKDHGMNKKRLIRLLKKGEGEYWKVIADPHSKAKLYDPIIPP
jgi:hypothetical protein